MAIRTLEPETTERAAPPPLGHNKPPIEDLIAMEFREALLADRPDFLTKFEQIIGAVDRVVITDDESLGRAGDLDNLLRAAESHINKAHVITKAPHLLAGRLADGQKNGMLDQLAGPRQALKQAMNAFVAQREAAARAERDRIAAEQRAAAERAAQAERARLQAEREAADAARNASNAAEREAANERARIAAAQAEEAQRAAALAPAAPVKSEPVRSDSGATVSTRTVWNSRVDDHKIAFKAVADDAKVREAIEGAVARLVRAGKREIKGASIWPTQEASSR